MLLIHPAGLSHCSIVGKVMMNDDMRSHLETFYCPRQRKEKKLSASLSKYKEDNGSSIIFETENREAFLYCYSEQQLILRGKEQVWLPTSTPDVSTLHHTGFAALGSQPVLPYCRAVSV